VTLRKLEYLLAFSVAFFAFIIYVLTLCPTVNFVDSGELSAVCATLGIAHPSSYPLFILIGSVVAHVPLGFRIIYQLNLLTAVECAAGIFFFFRFLVFFINEFVSLPTIRTFSKSETVTLESAVRIFLPALCGALILAFSETYWTQALSIEVYPLHILFIILLLFVFTKAIAYTVNADRKLQARYWIGFAYLLGMAFTNHLTAILLAPGFLFLYFYMNRFSAASWKKLILMAPFFILPLTLYAYIIIRAQSYPAVTWGNPINLERFYWLFSGKIYHGYLFNPAHSSSFQFDVFAGDLLPQYAYIPLLLVPFGVWKLYRESKALLIYTLLLFMTCLVFASNYSISDIESYFLLAYVTIALWMALGIECIVRELVKSSLLKAAGVVIIGISLLPLITNYSRVDESKNTWVEDYTRNMFNSLAPNAIILSHQYDYFNTASLYFQLVENVRPDVIVLDKNLMQRAWYYIKLKSRYTGMIELPEKEIDTYAEAMLPIERDLPYDTIQINLQILRLVRLTLNKNYNTHPIYVTQEIEEAYTPGYRRVPSGLAFRLYRDTAYHYIPMPELIYKQPTKDNWNTQRLMTAYAQSYANNAIYSDYLGMKSLALEQINKSLEILPNSDEAIMIKKQLLRWQ
jgi:hypothetical protein